MKNKNELISLLQHRWSKWNQPELYVGWKHSGMIIIIIIICQWNQRGSDWCKCKSQETLCAIGWKYQSFHVYKPTIINDMNIELRHENLLSPSPIETSWWPMDVQCISVPVWVMFGPSIILDSLKKLSNIPIQHFWIPVWELISTSFPRWVRRCEILSDLQEIPTSQCSTTGYGSYLKESLGRI